MTRSFSAGLSVVAQIYVFSQRRQKYCPSRARGHRVERTALYKQLFCLGGCHLDSWVPFVTPTLVVSPQTLVNYWSEGGIRGSVKVLALHKLRPANAHLFSSVYWLQPSVEENRHPRFRQFHLQDVTPQRLPGPRYGIENRDALRRATRSWRNKEK